MQCLTQMSTNSEESPENKKSKVQISLNNKSKLVISKLGSAAIKGKHSVIMMIWCLITRII